VCVCFFLFCFVLFLSSFSRNYLVAVVVIYSTMSSPKHKSIVFSNLLDMPICLDEKCGHAVRIKHLRKHLRQTHKIDADTIDETQKWIQTTRSEQRDNIEKLASARRTWLTASKLSFRSQDDKSDNEDEDDEEKIEVNAGTQAKPTDSITQKLVLTCVPELPVIQVFACDQCNFATKSNRACTTHISPHSDQRRKGQCR